MVLSKFGRAIRAAYITFTITLAVGICAALGHRRESPLAGPLWCGHYMFIGAPGARLGRRGDSMGSMDTTPS